MSRFSASRSLVWIIVAVIVAVNAVMFGGRATAWIADISGSLLTPVTGWMMRVRAVTGTMFNGVDAAKQNIALREELLQMQGRLAQQDVVRQEVAFYRAAAGLRERIGTDPIEAGIFSYPQGSGVRQVIINRGSIDWIAEGNMVVTPQGALVGTVERTFDHHAIVRMLGDPFLEIAARVMGTEVSGLVRVDGPDGLVLDLVQKDETVTEGSLIVTSGDDLRPAGFIIGTVRSVDNNATTLFKVVHITPAVSDTIAGRVLIVRP
jgi:rod shape-determining protein MreC